MDGFLNKSLKMAKMNQFTIRERVGFDLAHEPFSNLLFCGFRIAGRFHPVVEGVLVVPADGGGEPDPGEGLRQLDGLLRRRRPPRGRRRAGAPARALVDAQGGQEQRRRRQSQSRSGRYVT